MPYRGNARRVRTARKRRESSRKPKSKRKLARKLRSTKADEELLVLVRSGVEEFILNNATVEDFFKSIRAVAEKEKVYAHQLTRSVFSRIVREAIKKRNVGRSK